MKKQMLLSWILAAALLMAPTGALGAEPVPLSLPTGSGSTLYSNGADLHINTKDKLPTGAALGSLSGFTSGTDKEDATVAYWTVTDKDTSATTTYYVVLPTGVNVYAGSAAGETSTDARVTMAGGTVGHLAVGGGGTVSGNVSLSIAGGTAGSVSLGAGLNGAAVSLNAAGKTVELSGGVNVQSLSIGAGTGLIVPPSTDAAKNSLTAAGAVTVGDGGALINKSQVTAGEIKTTGGTSVIENQSDAQVTAASVNIGPGSSLTNRGNIIGSLNNQGNTNLDGGTVSGNIQTSGSLVRSEPLTINAGQSLTITGEGMVSSSIINNGNVTLEGNALVGGTVTNAGALKVNGGEVHGKVANNSSGTVQVGGGTLNNVTNSGKLAVSSGRIDGVVNNEAGGALELSGTGGIGGKVNNKAGGGLTMTAGTLSGSLQNDGAAAISGGALDGDVTNNQTMQLSGTRVKGTLANDGSLTLGDGVTLASDVENGEGGTISGSALTVAAGKTMVNEGTISAKAVTVNGTLENSGSITGESTLTNNGTVTNSGSIEASALTNTGALTNQDKGKISSAAVTNSGTLTNAKGGNITSGASLTNAGSLTNSGTIAAKVTNEKSGKLVNNSVLTGAVTNNGGSITNNESGSMSGSLANEEGGTVQNGGSISGDVNNKGTIKNTTDRASVSGKVTGKEVESTVATITATNKEKTVSLLKMPTGSTLTTTALAENSTEYKALKDVAKDAKVILAYDITCNNSFSGERTLVFHLGAKYANKPITALHYIKGIVDKYAGKADAKGDFSMPITSLSPFMLVEGATAGGGGSSKPVKTGAEPEMGTALVLLLMAAGAYIWRKRISQGL